MYGPLDSGIHLVLAHTAVQNRAQPIPYSRGVSWWIMMLQWCCCGSCSNIRKRYNRQAKQQRDRQTDRHQTNALHLPLWTRIHGMDFVLHKFMFYYYCGLLLLVIIHFYLLFLCPCLSITDNDLWHFVWRFCFSKPSGCSFYLRIRWVSRNAYKLDNVRY